MELPTLAPKFMQVACECPKTCVMLETLHLSAFKCVDVLMQVSARTFMQLASKLTASWLLFHTLAKGAFCEKKEDKKNADDRFDGFISSGDYFSQFSFCLFVVSCARVGAGHTAATLSTTNPKMELYLEL